MFALGGEDLRVPTPDILSHPIRFLAKIVMKVAGVLFAVLAMFQAGDLITMSKRYVII